jgi:hypothetical protein
MAETYSVTCADKHRRLSKLEVDASAHAVITARDRSVTGEPYRTAVRKSCQLRDNPCAGAGWARMGRENGPRSLTRAYTDFDTAGA